MSVHRLTNSGKRAICSSVSRSIFIAALRSRGEICEGFILPILPLESGSLAPILADPILGFFQDRSPVLGLQKPIDVEPARLAPVDGLSDELRRPGVAKHLLPIEVLVLELRAQSFAPGLGPALQTVALRSAGMIGKSVVTLDHMRGGFRGFRVLFLSLPSPLGDYRGICIW